MDNSLIIPQVPILKIELCLQPKLYFRSVESSLYKGTAVLIRAVRKILSSKEATMRRQKCVLEISDKGIKMIDKSKGEVREKERGGGHCELG